VAQAVVYLLCKALSSNSSPTKKREKKEGRKKGKEEQRRHLGKVEVKQTKFKRKKE
jgi:hypothetical protein